MDSIKKYTNELEINGFTVLKNIFDKKKIINTLEDVKSFKYRNTPKYIASLNKNKNTIYNVQFKFPSTFFLLSKNKSIIKILKNQLNDKFYGKIKKDKINFILRGAIARTEDNVGLPWHIDSFIPYQGLNPWIIVVTVPLEPYTINNGCFQVVKKSHQFGKYVSQKSNKNVTSLEADPGDAIIWNGGIWHRTAPNNSKTTRWSLIYSFCRWWIKPSFNHSQTIPPKMQRKLSNEELTLLDYYANIPENEHDKADLKSGY